MSSDDNDYSPITAGNVLYLASYRSMHWYFQAKLQISILRLSFIQRRLKLRLSYGSTKTAAGAILIRENSFAIQPCLWVYIDFTEYLPGIELAVYSWVY